MYFIFFIYHMSIVKCHMESVTYHLSLVTCHKRQQPQPLTLPLRTPPVDRNFCLGEPTYILCKSVKIHQIMQTF